MGSILITLIIVVIASMIGYAIGKQKQALELAKVNNHLDRASDIIAKKNNTINYLNAEIDHWQRRVHSLEGQLIRGSHLQAVPPVILQLPDPPSDVTAEALGLLTPKKQEAIKSLGPKEPPTPPNHKEVG